MDEEPVEIAGPFADGRQGVASMRLVQVLEENVIPLQNAENSTRKLPPQGSHGPG